VHNSSQNRMPHCQQRAGSATHTVNSPCSSTQRSRTIYLLTPLTMLNVQWTNTLCCEACAVALLHAPRRHHTRLYTRHVSRCRHVQQHCTMISQQLCHTLLEGGLQVNQSSANNNSTAIPRPPPARQSNWPASRTPMYRTTQPACIHVRLRNEPHSVSSRRCRELLHDEKQRC
jgi:hypothetical protein